MNENFNILLIGDIVGKSGRQCLTAALSKIIDEYKINFVIANGENAAGGFGMTTKIVSQLFEKGIDVITTGNHIWKNKDILKIIDIEPRLLRPANYPDSNPGKGWNIYKKENIKILVINLLGRVNLLEVDCPFQKISDILNSVARERYDISIVDFHAEVTSEKVAMGWFLDGKVTAVIGTHTHIQTADETILPKGTAYITDVGMTGAFDSVIGMEKENVISHFLTRMPIKFKVATDDLRINGVVVSILKSNMKAIKIFRINYKVRD